MSLVYHHAPGSDPLAPPLLLLHGTGGTERDLLGLARRLSPGSALLAPRGPVDENGSARFFRRLTEGVFDLDDARHRAQQLASWLDTTAPTHGLDPRSFIAIGFSNGANIATLLLQLHPEVLAAALLFRPLVVLDQPAPPASLTGCRVLLLNGRHDPLVPLSHPPRLATLLRAGGAHVTTHLLPATHGLTAEDISLAQAFLPLP